MPADLGAEGRSLTCCGIVITWEPEAKHIKCKGKLQRLLTRHVLGAGVGDGEPVLPSEAGPGQRIRLPGQTKVTTDEYKEFLGLGHGDIFDLDPDL